MRFSFVALLQTKIKREKKEKKLFLGFKLGLKNVGIYSK